MNLKFVWIALLASASVGAVAQDADTLGRARASGSIVMGVRESSAPLSYSLGADKFIGYHVELCERIVGALLPRVAIKYMPVTSQNRIPLLQNGTIDIECGSTSNTAARKQQVAFAVTTYVTEARFAVKAKSGITSAEQLVGKTIVTTTGTKMIAGIEGWTREKKFRKALSKRGGDAASC